MFYRLGILLLFFSNLVFAQQNQDFRDVKEHFDRQRNLITNEFKNRLADLPANEVAEMQQQFIEFMVKLDSVQNSTLTRALIKVKNEEDLQKIYKAPVQDIRQQQQPVSAVEKTPEYPGGINNLRTQIADLFYFDSDTSDKILKTNVTFLVEKDGYISNVFAEGDNLNFNRQAMIAVYLLPEKFTPATVNGTAVRYMYRLPLTMNFE
ncbi:Uncharacterised protein [Chryseobacterium taklimakanense]|uniref:TonB C-terminal domain-containing protein n=1 Tax=Chryseobacterium taklimakanense TaxID=536441 RepID=A0A239XFZ5_9FLAO|nr:hypothetical protein [Chryseobacterium taklimakanense]SNV45153.1 Uncharacterised protein [Chryseobacterium taklimakanense]